MIIKLTSYELSFITLKIYYDFQDEISWNLELFKNISSKSIDPIKNYPDFTRWVFNDFCV